ncbi:carboxylesterase/lipase family protein [Mangrovihabitans endophyticus]|uniref:Carboxylic ester hydrolase n=1 Tax=Mangrovihabitans endophyticus TaxID=1751298 RepID=A0A8J3FQA9_9ACTN|nr:carboxylesterase family protein [Mangrovihabitans endophyticus]GGL08228.1 carboxylic ester hydrolase [Mangrovihabitans endophyticus]
MTDARVVSTSTGRVRGTVTDGVARFLGIPYAQAPFGENRLRPPQPVRPWTGERDATAYGPTVPKGNYPAYVRHLLHEVDIPGEECLNLNVWAPADGDAQPVMVWIHGGSFTNGSGSVAEYDGSGFAADGIVTVTINYRLGAEGFLAVTGGTPNLGLLDMIAALRWVRSEIAAFGGDPARVTVAGESAGAMAIATLLAAPAATGLFTAAVLQSGAGANALSPAAADLVARRVADHLGVPATRDAIAGVPPQRLVQATSAISAQVIAGRRAEWGELALKRLPFAPVVDGEVLPRPPEEALAAGASAEVPLLLSTTRDEYRLFVVPSGLIETIDDTTLAAVANSLGLSAEGVEVYRANRPGAPAGDVLTDIQTDYRFWMPAVRLAQARPAGAAPTWIARFDALDRADNDGLGSCHAAEVPFVFGTTGLTEKSRLVGSHPSAKVTETVHGAWVRFLRDRDPGWPAADGTARPTALLGAGIEVVPDPQPAERDAWKPAERGAWK